MHRPRTEYVLDPCPHCNTSKIGAHFAGERSVHKRDDSGISSLAPVWICLFVKAVVISKPGPSPRLYWHQDCMWWDDPRAYSDYSPMNRQPDGARMGPHAARMEIWK